MSTQALRLEVVDFTDADHWRWRLTDADGAFLADHDVSLNPADPKYQALYNLPGYLWQYSSPDKRDEDERRLLAEVGAWIGDVVLGRTIGEKILQHGSRPIIVRVSVPQPAERLLVIPFEIAHVRGKPLRAHRVSLVFEPVVTTTLEAGPIEDRLRILALFSLPPAGSPLNLRRERRALNRLIAGLAGCAIELRVLQYGVTRDRLRDALLEGKGWDVVHFSGHGQPGSLLLETPDGRPDPINSEEVAELIMEADQRLKLVTLSACLSAASSIQQTMSWLGIAPASRDAGANPEATGAPEQSQEAAATVARAGRQARLRGSGDALRDR
jgi:CHAT domain